MTLEYVKEQGLFAKWGDIPSMFDLSANPLRSSHYNDSRRNNEWRQLSKMNWYQLNNPATFELNPITRKAKNLWI